MPPPSRQTIKEPKPVSTTCEDEQSQLPSLFWSRGIPEELLDYTEWTPTLVQSVDFVLSRADQHDPTSLGQVNLANTKAYLDVVRVGYDDHQITEIGQLLGRKMLESNQAAIDSEWLNNQPDDYYLNGRQPPEPQTVEVELTAQQQRLLNWLGNVD